MSEAPSTSAPKAQGKGKKVSGSAAAAADSAAAAAPPPFKPAKYGTYERQVVDYVRTATARNIWYYRDRMSVPRGPCSLPVLREAWVDGVIDENTLVWGQGLIDFLPIKNVRTLVPQIRTFEVQVATWIKRQFALKPALANARKQRAEQRVSRNNQVNQMY